MDSRHKTAILTVSYGASHKQSIAMSIGGIERAIADRFADYELRRAFTSRAIISRLKKQDGLNIDNMEEALDKAAADGIRKLIVQPTHLIKGYDYTNIEKTLRDYQDKFDQTVLGEPLFASEEDLQAAAKAVAERTDQYNDTETAVCLMGHGTDADSNSIYAKMQDQFRKAGYVNIYVGTMKAEPFVKDIVKKLKENGRYKKAVLLPFMVAAGAHAKNEMAGGREDSWKSILENEGYEVTCILEGMGRIPAIQDIYAAHVQQAVNRLEAVT